MTPSSPGDPSDAPPAGSRGASTSYTVSLSGKADRLARSLAEARELVRSSGMGALGHLPDITSEVFARGLVELAQEQGLDVDRAEIGDPYGDARTESAAIAREARLLRSRDSRAAMSRLAEAFPTLRARPGVRPWDPEALDAWLGSSSEVTSGSRDAAAFILATWNGSGVWAARFDVHRALSGWDAAHRAAFAVWVSAPWWP